MNRRPSFLLHDSGWRHALAEVAFIVVGVLVALAAQAWWQDRQDRRDEREALLEIRSALAADAADLRADLASYRTVDGNARFLLEHLRRRRPYSPALDAKFGSLLRFRRHVSNSAAYESLRSRGLELISDDSLRLAISTFFTVDAQGVATGNEMDTRLVTDAFQPYLRRHFALRTQGMVAYATPVDYDALLSDTELQGLISERIFGLLLTATFYEAALKDAAGLDALVGRRLRQLQSFSPAFR